MKNNSVNFKSGDIIQHISTGVRFMFAGYTDDGWDMVNRENTLIKTKLDKAFRLTKMALVEPVENILDKVPYYMEITSHYYTLFKLNPDNTSTILDQLDLTANISVDDMNIAIMNMSKSVSKLQDDFLDAYYSGALVQAREN